MEKNQTWKEIKIAQKSGTYNYKLIIPLEVERKIRFTCQKEWNNEWSGTLFFKYKGSFEDNNLEIKCVDFYLMDIGSQTYTEFDMNPDVIAYMTDNPELLDCQLGLIHSHGTLATFFSGTDIETLKEEGIDRNNFVSLIVNNAGEYTAAITRKIESKKVQKTLSYKFFSEEEREITENNENTDIEIEWFNLEIVKEEDNFKDIENRLNEIRQQKKETSKTDINKYFESLKPKSILPSLIKSYPYNNLTGIADKAPIQKSLFEPSLSEKKENNNVITADPKVVDTILKQLITCSILIPNEDKIDINKWAENMPRLYEKRFGSGEEGITKFMDWIDLYVEYLTWSVADENLLTLGLDQTEVQSVYAIALVDKLSALTSNKYIELYIEELEKYIL